MCGFLGKISLDSFSDEDLFDANKRIICRGPDETKFLNQNNLDQGKVFFSFVFNRLSIIDLTDTASQPMVSYNKENLMMFNGEIYNYKELKEILLSKGVTFNSKNQAESATKAAISLLGSKKCNGDIEPRLFSEDFSVMASEKPGCFVLMGNGTSEQHSRPLHADNYDFNDELLVIGSSYWTELVEQQLK